MLNVATKLMRGFGGLKVRYKLMVLHNLFYLVLSGGVYFSLMPAIGRWASEAKARETAAVPAVPAGEFYDSIIVDAQLTIFAVLFVTYWIAVLLLEGFVMRSYIYQPLKRLLAADEASRRGDIANELVDESGIQEDELGRLIRSRNATVRQIRLHEQELEQVAADLRQKNRLLETAKRNIADQDRLASLGLLTASVAHEINTPLAVLQGSIEKLLETVGEPAARERLDRMLRVSLRLQRISESMLDFSRVRKEEHEPLSVRRLVDEAWALVAIDDKAAKVAFTNAAGEWVRVLGNSDRLLQLFVNLLRNSLHAVSEGGVIAVKTGSCPGDGRKMAAVTVEDNGPGIPGDVLPDIFEAFVTSRLDARGSGLGLTIAEGVAHQHGGAIVASNRPEGGACLEVRLPVAGEPPRPEELP